MAARTRHGALHMRAVSTNSIAHELPTGGWEGAATHCARELVGLGERPVKAFPQPVFYKDM